MWCVVGSGVLCIFFFEEKRILRRKRTGTPDHTRDSHSATKRERDVDTAKLKVTTPKDHGTPGRAIAWCRQQDLLGGRGEKPWRSPGGAQSGRGARRCRSMIGPVRPSGIGAAGLKQRGWEPKASKVMFASAAPSSEGGTACH